MKLFEPIKIKNMELKNHIVMPPMMLNMGFNVNQRALAFYKERAKGGCGAIILPLTSVDMFISDEIWGRHGNIARYIEDCHRLADDVHAEGVKLGIQLWHAKYLPSGLGPDDTRGRPIAPSAVADRQELTTQEIDAIVAKFGQAAAACKRAGFDFVEIHGAHSYLPCEFFSPLDNRRNDMYGGDRRRRMNFGLETTKSIRAAVGSDYPIFFRLGAQGSRPGDTTLEDACEFAIELEKAGIDCLDISVALYTDPGISALPAPDQPHGTFVPLAEAIKRRVRVPVIAVGRIHKLEIAESILTERKADLVAVGRQLIADPYWPQKVAAGKQSEVRPCLSCNVCIDAAIAAAPYRCPVNAFAGREADWVIAPAAKKKRVFVIGGGPAGMEAARLAAQRGHNVALFEKAPSLGGQLTIAQVPPHKKEIGELSLNLAYQVKLAGVRVRLNCEAAPAMLLSEKPDAVIIATGSKPSTPAIKGVDGPNVVNALDVLAGRPTGKRVVVLGGELVGCETAEYLAGQGKQVTITRRGPKIAIKMSNRNRASLIIRLRKLGITMLTGVQYEEITDKGLVITSGNGLRQTLEADTIVLATGAVPDNRLAKELKGKVAELYVIGDSLEPRRILEAISDGAKVGIEV
ncbi:MAG: FAD-dependent oxidoreductase [Chloroflexota bacterium]